MTAATGDAFADKGAFGASLTHRRASLWLILISLLMFLPGFVSNGPMDRDEPRFAQASKQMIETGDYVDIRFQHEARHKKPVGIYWMQAAVVKTAEALGVPNARSTISIYRLPSLIAAILAVLLTYWAALPFVTRRHAFVAALLFGACILIGVEARLAKTDAVITATVIAAMGAFARLYLRLPSDNPTRWQIPAVFWSAIAIGLLVKGPITPMVPLFAALVLLVKDRAAPWRKDMRFLPGFAWVLLLVAPWFAMILIKTGGNFLSDSVGQDMLAKVGSGKENHGAPPLTYFGVFWATAWPLAPFVALAAPFVFKKRAEPKIAFLLAWLIPSWILFEAVPTKLPHYVLPLYPALAILVAVVIERAGLTLGSLWRKAIFALLPLMALAVAGAGLFLLVQNASGLWIAGGALLGVILITLAVLAWLKMNAGEAESAAYAATAAALVTYGLAYTFIVGGPGFTPYRLSPRLAEAARAALPTTATCQPKFATISYREPSLVFLTRTDLFMTDAKGAAGFMNEGPCRIAFIEAKDDAAFKAAVTAPDMRRASVVSGTNLNGGKKLDISVYVRDGLKP